MDNLVKRERKRRCSRGTDGQEGSSKSKSKRPRSSSTPGAATANAKWAGVFQNELILSKIIKHLPEDSLLDLRSTSASMNRSCVNRLRTETARVDLCNSNCPAAVSRANKAMEEYAKLMRNSPKIPFTNYKILSTIRDQILDDFLDLCGHCIQHLHILSPAEESSGVLDLDRIGKAIIEKTPKLVVLKLTLGMRRSFGYGSFISPAQQLPHLRRLVLRHHDPHADWVALICDILRSAAGLRGLRIRTWGHSPPNSFLVSLRDGANLGALKILELSGSAGIHASSFQVLMEATNRGLRLESFLAIIQRYVPQEPVVGVLNHFLRTQSATLHTLKLVLDALHKLRHGFDGPIPTTVRIPNLTEVTTFEIWRLGKWPIALSYDGGTLAQAMPKLKGFGYFDSYDDSRLLKLRRLTTSLVDLNLAAHLGVTSLDLWGNRPALVVRDLGVRFPSLTTIALEIWFPGWRDLSSFWTTWPALRIVQLQIWNKYPRSDDQELEEFLSGVPKARIRHLQNELKVSYWEVEALKRLQDKYKSKPGISDLKHLQKFTLTIGETKGWPCAKLGNVGGYLGLAVASRTLQHLEVTSVNQLSGCGILITPSCRKVISKALMPLAVVEID